MVCFLFSSNASCCLILFYFLFLQICALAKLGLVCIFKRKIIIIIKKSVKKVVSLLCVQVLCFHRQQSNAKINKCYKRSWNIPLKETTP